MYLGRKEKLLFTLRDKQKAHEVNYTTHELQLGEAVPALKNEGHDLNGAKYANFTNYKRLQHIFDQKAINMRCP